ncbi:MAG: DUF3798 domain-containing protein [Candidatus Adiutrix sp.]|jgi:hypothetical protein|nr:DUF3798 domain-containing protein [Candidatus Adiutrix sp.]
MRRHVQAYGLALLLLAILAAPAWGQGAEAPAEGYCAVFVPERYREALRGDMEGRWGRRAELRAFADPRDPASVTLTLETLALERNLEAVVIGEAPFGSAEGIARLRAARPELPVFAVEPDEVLERVGQAASLTIALNQPARGFIYPTMAARMGAGTLVYLSFPRHQELSALSRQYRVLSAVSTAMGLNLVTDFNGPDPRAMSDEAVEKFLRQKVELYLNSYGRHTAFMTTSGDYSRLMAPMIAEAGGALLEPNMPSLMLGLPEALGLAEESAAIADSWRRLLTLQDEHYLETRPAGQFASWAFPYPHTAILAAMELAEGAIGGQADTEGQADLYNLDNITAALGKFSPGVKWQVAAHIDHLSDSVIPQVILVLQDSYWFGQGFQGFTRLNIPSTYYRIR